jgi:hypothetical protein
VAAAMVMPAAMFEFAYRSRIWADRISCPLESCWIRAAPVADEVAGMYGYRVLLRYHDSRKSCLPDAPGLAAFRDLGCQADNLTAP